MRPPVHLSIVAANHDEPGPRAAWPFIIRLGMALVLVVLVSLVLLAADMSAGMRLSPAALSSPADIFVD